MTAPALEDRLRPNGAFSPDLSSYKQEHANDSLGPERFAAVAVWDQ